MQVAHAHKVPLIVDNTFGMGGMRILPGLEPTPDEFYCQGI
jgi:O-acetylhomoserine/O-acetylserine sulfhydrylase-like pyridoxal-dependent enzyme